MNLIKLAFVACTIFTMAGCMTTPAQEDMPAVIADPTPQSHAELLQVLTKALNGAPVTIADDALTQNSVLIIERQSPRDLENRPLKGRDLGRPKPFQLVLNEGICVLVDQSDGKRWVLPETSCVPEHKADKGPILHR